MTTACQKQVKEVDKLDIKPLIVSKLEHLRKKVDSQKGLIKANTLGQVEAYAYMLTVLVKSEEREDGIQKNN